MTAQSMNGKTCGPPSARAATRAPACSRTATITRRILLWLPERDGAARVGMVDFQDALRAHPAWDLHSLLQDARRDVSPELEAAALERYFAQRPETDREQFLDDYAALATLNEARILGIFARLIVRDGKPRYRAFMPRLWRHLNRNLERPGMEGLKLWFTPYMPDEARA